MAAGISLVVQEYTACVGSSVRHGMTACERRVFAYPRPCPPRRIYLSCDDLPTVRPCLVGGHGGWRVPRGKTDNGIVNRVVIERRDAARQTTIEVRTRSAQVTRVRRLACCDSAAAACDRVRVHAFCARAAVPARRSVGGQRGEPGHFADAFDLSMATSLAASSMTVLWRASRLFSELRPFHHSMNSA